MLSFTEEERQSVEDYYISQSPGARVNFTQKIYAEIVAGHKHDVWDLHASDGRWWIITNPTNLYSHEQFPNMDIAVTFHIGLCIRVPRTQEQNVSDQIVRPFANAFLKFQEISDALIQAQNVADYQAIGMRCREALLSFTAAAQDIATWSEEEKPKRADFRAWTELIINTILSGPSQKERRHLFKATLMEAWTFANWLTHAQSATWYDAEAAQSITSHAFEGASSLVLRYIRLVPDECPKCGSPHLSPENGWREDQPETEWQRPVCEDCGWTGTPVVIGDRSLEAEEMNIVTREGNDSDEEFILPQVPLAQLDHPSRDRTRRKPFKIKDTRLSQWIMRKYRKYRKSRLR